MTKVFKNRNINNIQNNNNLIQGGVVMKSNMFKMMVTLTLCICTFVFAADAVDRSKMTKEEYIQYLETKETKEKGYEKLPAQINNANVINTNNVDIKIQKAEAIKAAVLEDPKELELMKKPQKPGHAEPVSITDNSAAVSNSGIVATDANNVVPDQSTCTGNAKEADCMYKGNKTSYDIPDLPIDVPANSEGLVKGRTFTISGDSRLSTELCVDTDSYYYEQQWLIADPYTGTSYTGWFSPASGNLECETVDLDPGTYSFYHYDSWGDGYVYDYVNGTNLGYFYFSTNYEWGYMFALTAPSCDDAAACNYGAAEDCTYDLGCGCGEAAADPGYDCNGDCISGSAITVI